MSWKKKNYWSFSHDVFKSLLSESCSHLGLSGKGLMSMKRSHLYFYTPYLVSLELLAVMQTYLK